ncbi:MAG: hypothetical protein Q8908_02720 [Bacteroidota bacterium]|nr:hypothetical protein [Bacteroidota bacterium]
MHLFVQFIHSLSPTDFLTQLHSCFDQIDLVSDNFKTKRRIVKITVFTPCADNSDYLLKMNLLKDAIEHFDVCQAPVSLVSQAPIDGGTILEVWLMEYPETGCEFTFNQGEQVSALHLECPDFSCLFSTQYSASHQGFKENTFETFNLLDATLHETGFDYGDIVRQWNYIEDITLLDTVSDEYLQNYQIFNDVRSFFYEQSNFTNGYPAATGIGAANGGCTIEVIALKEKNQNSVKPITNFLQVDAHSYSSTVLVGDAIKELPKASTPKFERGKFIHFGDEGFLFISGTASIIGEKTVYTENVENQTITTIQNIEHLLSTNNLNKNNINNISKPRLHNYRVYLKNESDYPKVKSLCDAHFGPESGFFVKADVCRSNLLVEIEANYGI